MKEITRNDRHDGRPLPDHLQARRRRDVRGVCRRMVAQFAQSNRPEDSERVAKVSLLSPGVVEGFVPPLDAGAVPDWPTPWAWGTRALLAFRTGDAKSAVTCAERSEALASDERQRAFNLTFLAMAHHQLRDSEKSREAFDRADRPFVIFRPGGWIRMC